MVESVPTDDWTSAPLSELIDTIEQRAEIVGRPAPAVAPLMRAVLVLREQERWSDLIKLCQHLVRQWPDDIAARINLADAARHIERDDLAEEQIAYMQQRGFVRNRTAAPHETRSPRPYFDLASDPGKFAEFEAIRKAIPFEHNRGDLGKFLIIYHINHTGGETFVDMMRKEYEGDEGIVVDAGDILTDLDKFNLMKKALLNRPNARLVYTHDAIPVHLGLSKPAKYLAMFRHPISRLIARYYWVHKHRHTNFKWVDQCIKDEMGFEYWVDQVYDQGWYPGGLRPGSYLSNTWKRWGLIPDELSECDDIEQSRYVIDNFFSFVGITEMFDASAFCIFALLGINRVPYWRLRGHSDAPKLTEISPTILAKLARVSEVDSRLYQEMRQRFEQTYGPLIDFFNREVKSLRLLGAPPLDEDWKTTPW